MIILTTMTKMMKTTSARVLHDADDDNDDDDDRDDYLGRPPWPFPILLRFEGWKPDPLTSDFF